MTRRVYELGDGLLGQIEAFRAKVRTRSEVDAVRILLRAGLMSFETKDDLIARHEAGEPGAIFGGHPLIRSLHQEDGNLVKVMFRDGTAYEPKGGVA
ncbi:hypothetical protein [Paracoccus hibiscisoli]|uniref:Uncharacterized protein n=1 Tax=Paracoccus hibiscisoli TaxID=2023261 RepID=A0A4U0QUW9_9RHOB|nr:hypothetical protein [Paracoccus hibiscisoli]TJZ85796.1 hypothetical protein FA740_05195 [Paracoccus hibiscisoli]